MTIGDFLLSRNVFCLFRGEEVAGSKAKVFLKASLTFLSSQSPKVSKGRTPKKNVIFSDIVTIAFDPTLPRLKVTSFSDKVVF